MSTPITSTGPTSPEQSSPLRPAAQFRAWFNYIIDWIKALSPAGASSYDSGWVDVTVNSPWVALNSSEKPQVRRMGKQVIMRGSIGNAGVATNASYDGVLTIPTGFRPAANVVIRLGTSAGPQSATSNVQITGSCTLRTNAVLSGYYSWVTTWTVD